MEAKSSANSLFQGRHASVDFSGKKAEYFKLWIVNLLLSVITLGIYSAWAKVRNTQYLYGHTSIEGHRFEYLAKPMQILRGRIIAAIVFILFAVLSSINPLISLVLALLLLAASPWLINQGLRFSMRMTSYRNVRFNFAGSYMGAALNFIILPILSVFTLYLALPWVHKRIDEYMVSNTSFGGKPIKASLCTGDYYMASFVALGASIMLLIATFILGVGSIIGAALGLQGSEPQVNPAAFAGMGLMMLVYFAGIYFVQALYRGMIRNHVFNNIEIEQVAKTHSDLKLMPYGLLMLTNALLLLCTLGLAFPIVTVRTQAFMAKATDMTIADGADQLANTVSGEDSAFGEEAAGMFDTDMSIV